MLNTIEVYNYYTLNLFVWEEILKLFLLSSSLFIYLTYIKVTFKEYIL